MKTVRRECARAAFTLVELLVAAGITALIAVFVAVIVRNVSTTWTRSGSRLRADAQARLALDRLQLDLQGALVRDDGNVWLAADVLAGSRGNPGAPWQAAAGNAKPSGALSLQMTAPHIADARFGPAGVWLRFFTTSRATPTAASAPVAVSYQLVRRFTSANPGNHNTAYLLHRIEARPGTADGRLGVIDVGYDITADAYTTPSAAGNDGTQSADPCCVRVVSSLPRGSLDCVLADHVIDFGVRGYVRDRAAPGGLRLVFPADENAALTNAPTAQLRATAALFPDVIDVMLRILTDEGAALIANLENAPTSLPAPAKYHGDTQEWWWGIALENSRVYTRRIALHARPL